MDQQAKIGGSIRDIIIVTLITFLFAPLISLTGTFVLRAFEIDKAVTNLQALIFLGAIAFLRALYFYITTPWDVEARLKIQDLEEKQAELQENAELYNKQLEATINNEIALKAILKYYMDFDETAKGGIAIDLELVNQIEKDREDLFIVYYIDKALNKKVLYLQRRDELNVYHKTKL